MKLSLGYDYGSDSARVIAVNITNGEVLTEQVFAYPRWAKGMYCEPTKQQFRQHPLDYIEAFTYLSQEALKDLQKVGEYQIIGIGIDGTGSTPMAVDADGVSLALKPEFAENPDAMAILWKDHTSIAEADEITALAKSGKYPDYTKYCGGAYSSEWYWAKALRVIRSNPEITQHITSFVEHSDWMGAIVTGNTALNKIKRNRCAAGHKGMWHAEFGGFPSVEFFQELNPKLAEIRNTVGTETYTADQVAGYISKEWAEKTGLPENTPVAVGLIDAHAGAIGAGIQENTLCRVMGTSTCDILVAKPENETAVVGISGQVDGSVIPNMIGYEAGQSSFGDAFAWFKNVMVWTLEVSDLSDDEKKKIESKILMNLEKEALQIPNDNDNLIALDWLNGRRSPFVNFNVAGGFYGLNLGTTAPHMYKSLVNATNIGAKEIILNFEQYGLKIDKILCLGGIPQKSKLIMQSMADILNKECHVVANEQCCALGSAILGAVVGQEYKTVEEASVHIASATSDVYKPNPDNQQYYAKLHDKYKKMGKFFDESEL